MTTVILVIHLMIAAALVGMVLVQRSEGGALGIGGGGGFMSGRGAANLLTRITAILAGVFFATSILLAILARQNVAPSSILDGAAGTPPSNSSSSRLPDLQPLVPPSSGGQQVPQSQ